MYVCSFNTKVVNFRYIIVGKNLLDLCYFKWKYVKIFILKPYSYLGVY